MLSLRFTLTSYNGVVLCEQRELLTHSEVCDLEDARLVQQQVARFDIFMYYSFGVQVGKTVQQLSEVVVALPDGELVVRGLVQHVLEDRAAVLHHLTGQSLSEREGGLAYHVYLPLLVVI